MEAPDVFDFVNKSISGIFRGTSASRISILPSTA
jgi:hypothetical protein